MAGVRVVSTDGPRIRAESNFLIVESLSDREPTVNLVGRYLDTLLETDTGLLLQDRWCVVDNYRIRTSLIIPV